MASINLGNYESLFEKPTRLGMRGINPLFPLYPDGYYSDPEHMKQRFGSREAAPHFDLWDKEFIPELADAGTPSILVGFVRLSPKAINNISKSVGINLNEFFRPDFLAMRGDRRYSDKEIGHYYAMILKQCRVHKVRFSTCYIRNGIKDYGQYQDLWANKKDCCDVIDNVKAFDTTSQVIPWETRMKHAPCKAAAVENQKDEKQFDRDFQSKSSTPKSGNRPQGEIHDDDA